MTFAGLGASRDDEVSERDAVGERLDHLGPDSTTKEGARCVC
jgi:hypothetical protein